MRRIRSSRNQYPLYKPTPRILRIDAKALIPKESDLQKSLYNRIRTKQLYNQYPIEFFIYATCNEHLGGVQYINHLKQMGMRPGVADIGILICKHLPAFIELKRTAKAKLTPAQEEFRDMCYRFGYGWHLCTDVDEGEQWFNDYLTNLAK